MPGYTFGLGFMVRQGPGIVGVMGCNSRRMVATAAHRTDHVLPPLWDLTDAGAGACDLHAQPAPEYAFDQRIAW